MTPVVKIATEGTGLDSSFLYAADLDDYGWRLLADRDAQRASLVFAYSDVIRGYATAGASLNAALTARACEDWLSS